MCLAPADQTRLALGTSRPLSPRLTPADPVHPAFLVDLNCLFRLTPLISSPTCALARLRLRAHPLTARSALDLSRLALLLSALQLDPSRLTLSLFALAFDLVRSSRQRTLAYALAPARLRLRVCACAFAPARSPVHSTLRARPLAPRPALVCAAARHETQPPTRFVRACACALTRPQHAPRSTSRASPCSCLRCSSTRDPAAPRFVRACACALTRSQHAPRSTSRASPCSCLRCSSTRDPAAHSICTRSTFRASPCSHFNLVRQNGPKIKTKSRISEILEIED